MRAWSAKSTGSNFCHHGGFQLDLLLRYFSVDSFRVVESLGGFPRCPDTDGELHKGRRNRPRYKSWFGSDTVFAALFFEYRAYILVNTRFQQFTVVFRENHVLEELAATRILFSIPVALAYSQYLGCLFCQARTASCIRR